MLSEQEKVKIVLEETYRNEVRNKLDVGAKKKRGLMPFLNSNFGSFLLSTVIVGSISFFYARHQEQLVKAEKEKVEWIANEQWKSKLYTEMAHRLNTLRSLADTLKDYQSKDIYLAYHDVSIGNDPSINATYFNFKSYYPEFKQYGVLRVLDELIQYDTAKDYSALRLALLEVNPDIVNLGQNWFYQINGKINLPFRIRIRYNDIKKVNYYNLGKGFSVLEKDDSFQKLWYMGASERVKTLVSRIDEIRLLQ